MYTTIEEILHDLHTQRNKERILPIRQDEMVYIFGLKETIEKYYVNDIIYLHLNVYGCCNV